MIGVQNTFSTAGPQTGPPARALALSGRRTAALTALFITGFATFVNLYVTQPLLPDFRQLFHASELLVSLTVSAPVLAVALTAPFLGVMADSIGRKRVIVTAMFGLALSTLLAATAANLGQFVAWRFLQGLFIPGIIAVAMAYISEESPSHVVGATMAIYITGTVTGGFAGRFISGLVTHHWGWRIDFLVLGILTVAGAIATYQFLPRSTGFVRGKAGPVSIEPLRKHLGNRQLLAIYAVGFNVLFCMVAAFTYVNFYLADAPFFLGPAGLGLIFTVYLIGAAVTPTAGRMLDRVGGRRALAWAIGMVATGAVLTLVRSLPVIVSGLALTATGVFICQAAATSHVGKAAGEARSAAAGLYVALYYLGGFAGSIVPGLFWKHAGWHGCVAIVLAVQALTFFISQKLWKD